MRSFRFLAVLVLGLLTQAPRVAAALPEDLGPIATESALIFGGVFSTHLDELETVLRSNKPVLEKSERERLLALVASMKKDVREYIDTANLISRGVNLFGKSELLGQAFNLSVLLSQSAYRSLIVEQGITESVADPKWRAEFKNKRSVAHTHLIRQSQKCFDYAFDIITRP